MIKLTHVHAAYGKKAILHDISFHSTAKEFVGILGPNGSGKTSLIKSIAGLLPPSAGRVEIAGQLLKDMGSKKRAKHIALVPQRVNANLGLSVYSFIAMGRYAHLSFWGILTRQDQQCITQAMHETKTYKIKNRMLSELSGGELQRVILARALAQNSPILLLDEATSGLDIAHSIQSFDLLKQKKDTGMSIVAVIHDINLAALYCDKLIFLKNGKIAYAGALHTENFYALRTTLSAIVRH